MRDGLARRLARVKERVGSLRGRGESGDRYVLLPAGAGRRRRLAEVGAAAGVVVVVLALVGATVALRSSSSDSPSTPGPGLPAPTEFAVPPSGSISPTGSAADARARPGWPGPDRAGADFPPRHAGPDRDADAAGTDHPDRHAGAAGDDPDRRPRRRPRSRRRPRRRPRPADPQPDGADDDSAGRTAADTPVSPDRVTKVPVSPSLGHSADNVRLRPRRRGLPRGEED